MNEELKIIIKAVTDEAKKNLADVKKELNGIKDQSNKSGKSLKEAFSGVSKVAAGTVASVVAITAAIVTLGNKTQEYTKVQSKLISGFQAAGLSADQAGETYNGLYRYLGDSDRAVEAANHLAKLTTNTENLSEWVKITQGVYATFGDSLPIEGLTEAANETARTSKVVGVMADALNWAGVSEDDFNTALANTNSLTERESLIRSTLNKLYSNASSIYEKNNSALLAYNESQTKVSNAMAEASKYITPLMTNLNNLAATLFSVLGPAIQTVCAWLTAFVQYIIAAVKAVGSFFGISASVGNSVSSINNSLSNTSSSVANISSGASNAASSFENAANSAAKLKKQVMGFDELNVMSSTSTTSSSSGGSGIGSGISDPIVSIPSISASTSALDDFSKKVDEIKGKIKAILVLAGIVASVFAGWGLINFIKDLIILPRFVEALKKEYHDAALDLAKTNVEAEDFILKETNLDEAQYNYNVNNKKLDESKAKLAGVMDKLKSIVSTIMIIGGIIVTVKGYTDAWTNSVGWGNLAITIAGLGLVVGGAALKFGALGAELATCIAGVALMVLGVKDFIDNGPTLQNTILIIGGAIAVAVAAATMGLGPLVGAIIGAAAAVAAFTVAIICEKPAILSTKEAEEQLTAAKEAAKQAEDNLTQSRLNNINALEAAENAQKALENAEKAAGITGADLQAQVDSGALSVENMTEAQRTVYKAYLDNEQKQADLKKAQEEVKKATDELAEAKRQETIASFENDLALAKESGSYDDYKQSVITAFNEGKLSAEDARKLIGKSMSEMSSDAQKTFMEDLPGDIKDGLDPKQYMTTRQKMKNWFSDTWESCKNVFSDVGDWFKGIGEKAGEAIGGALKTVVNWILDKIENTINKPIKMINDAIDIINKIPGVSINKMSLINVPRLATGGIATRSTIANIGEAGREAVLPLDRNTGWMDTLADRINNRGGSPSKIVLMLDKKTLGEASIESINDITRSTGTLKLQLV